ncbi:CBS domain-containing protein [Ascidiimonas sp. W6]|uniref:CBS domain-containing protein n=1 Tax=Ascidiimonas meishanensis TaxID=3128903 RepID=UPI0030EBC9AF
MGEHKVSTEVTIDTRTKFISHLLNDIKALEYMLANNLFEDDIVRIGAEQEFCLVDAHWRPSNQAIEILNLINNKNFTTELALYNLEINLDPVELKGKSFSIIEQQLKSLLSLAMETAAKKDTKVLLTGILPTISNGQLSLDYMTPNPRYAALNDAIKSLRGTNFQLNLRGVDELSVKHDSVLYEACNTSFQLHLQIAPDDFIASYNWAQAISAPVLGCAVNSPLLLGRELWNETRIALFQQSIDTRSSSYALKDKEARVSFGQNWESGSIVNIYKHNIASYPVILVKDIDTNAIQELEQGRIPKLSALNLHNGTIYRWNRACYGVGGGKPHMRIENRYIPAGPTIADEMANFAFWVGLMKGRPIKYDDMPSIMDFRDAKENFIKAARTGKESILKWDDKYLTVNDLILKELLPIAYNGLEKCEIDKSDMERLLGIIEERVAGNSGASWSVSNYRKLRNTMKKDDALVTLTQQMYENQQSSLPVHKWPDVNKNINHSKSATLVRHIMSTQLYTLNENDLASLGVQIMQWKNIHHIPIRNNMDKLVGLLTWSHIENFQKNIKEFEHKNVSEIMIKEVITVSPDTSINEAVLTMKSLEIGCLPVVYKEQLVGIITLMDLSTIKDE